MTYRPDLTEYTPYIEALTDTPGQAPAVNEEALYKMSKTDAVKIAIESALEKVVPDVIVNKKRKLYHKLNF